MRPAVVTYSLGFVGVTGSVVGLLAWLLPGGLEHLPWNAWAGIAITLAYTAGLLATLLVISRRPAATNSSKLGDAALYEAIVSLMRDALERTDYREVVRLGDALSRPLFESGEFTSRLELGRLTEEAAAHIGAKEIQYQTLVDTIGWSLIELGRFEEAEKSIRHGLALAEEAGDAFYRAKAYRHLGAIERRRGHVEDSMRLYEQAREAATDISDSAKARAMEAGITYAIGHLQFSRREYPQALETSDSAVKMFSELDDVYRVDMALVLKADIQVALGQPERAKDTYRRVIQSSKLNRESVHYARAVIGLAELFIRGGQLDDAKRLLDRLTSSEVSDMPQFSDRFRAARSALDASHGHP